MLSEKCKFKIIPAEECNGHKYLTSFANVPYELLRADSAALTIFSCQKNVHSLNLPIIHLQNR